MARRLIRSSRLRAAAVLVLLSIAGCSPAPVGVQGKVTLDGQPLDEAIVYFVPLDVPAKRTGGAVTAGSYQLEGQDGLLPGKYRVEFADNAPLNTPAAALVKRRRFPYQYTHNSPLMIELQSGGSTNFDFDLKSTGP